MNYEKFTIKSQEALSGAQQIAMEYGQTQIEPEHILHVLVSDPEGTVPAVIRKIGADLNAVQAFAHQAVERLPKVSGGAGQVYLSARMNKLLNEALKEAGKLKDEFVSTEHLLIALAEDTSSIGEFLRSRGISRDTIYRALKDIRGARKTIRC